jgi:hypothetical protein
MIPKEIMDWFRYVFEDANRHLCEKIQNVPNIPEPHLDTTLVSHLMGYAAPTRLMGQWAIKIDTHFIGGLAQHRTWEIADIGVFVFFQQAGKVVRQKVVLLQSKRLYPDVGDVVELENYDYMIGMARLGMKDVSQAPLLASKSFSFTMESAYQALQRGKQVDRIKEFLKTSDIPVFYLLYNPWGVPCTIKTPLDHQTRFSSTPVLGTRIVAAEKMFEILDGIDHFPSVIDIDRAMPLDDNDARVGGWRLEYFMSDLLLGCFVGKRFTSADDSALFEIFNRRSGPIMATVAVTVDVPEDVKLPD